MFSVLTSMQLSILGTRPDSLDIISSGFCFILESGEQRQAPIVPNTARMQLRPNDPTVPRWRCLVNAMQPKSSLRPHTTNRNQHTKNIDFLRWLLHFGDQSHEAGSSSNGLPPLSLSQNSQWWSQVDDEPKEHASDELATLPILPPEVLGEIFVLCLPDRDADRLNVDNAPAVLCQVSAYWRATAISEPRLWDTIILPTSSNYPLYHKFIRSGGAQRWFDRTGTTWPLTFGEESSDEPSSSLIGDYLGIIITYARRFKHLSLVMTKIMHLESFRRGFPQGIFDQLQSSFALLHPTDEQQNPPGLSKTRHAPPHRVQAKARRVLSSTSGSGQIRFTLGPNNQHRDRQADEILGFERTSARRPAVSSTQLWGIQSNLHPHFPEIADFGGPTPLRAVGCPGSLRFPLLVASVTFPTIRHLRFEFEGVARPSAHLSRIAETCRNLSSSLETVTFGWKGEANRDAPVEASEFIAYLIREPGAFTSLRHIVTPCKAPKIGHIVDILRPRPRLNVTVTVAPNKLQGWARVMEGYVKTIQDRIHILSTDNYHLLQEDSYFRNFLSPLAPSVEGNTTAASNHFGEWRGTIEKKEQSSEIKDRIGISSTDKYSLSEASYFA
ncbi:hypothetical protein FA13DRAFT_1713281 [Coprinellus micaceus]|uniref:F-box domain-containing protein n=1 Tax=Coprinellus micaceus TaxID=71717 RepID=A0A4Y7SZ17_COPMI|nr:hypothetical protein FA13DRAFT_1713281 [Coprinellus micaceus]